MRPQTIIERLDFVAKRIPGLKFTPPQQLKPGEPNQDYGCFMSCDMYYIEIKVDQSHQTVKDVVINHNYNNKVEYSCPVLTKVLIDHDFETFAKHLMGLHSIYQISTNDQKVKQRAYPALTALESDLAILYEHQRRRINDCNNLVHKSPIGVMEPRKGGLPVRLTFFITPYDMIDSSQKGLINLSINNIIDKNLGLSGTVEIEGSSNHKIQVRSLISSPQNANLPSYSPFSIQNSEKLPAQFVLKLSQPFPMLNTSINQIINDINEPATIKEYLSTLSASCRESLISLIARKELDLNKGPFCRTLGADNDSSDLQKHVYTVNLADQCHTYHILDNYLERQEGVYVTKIPFTHPTSIPSILKVLRQQAMFNFVIGSCIRRNNCSSDDISQNDSSNIFDIIPVNLNNICVSFEHPSRESLATLEIDFKELSCRLHALDKESVCSDTFATKVLQKCWSIPITLRLVLKKCNEQRQASLEDANRRRERELKELLANDQAHLHQQSLPQLHYHETVMQSRFGNLTEKSNSRDLNSMAEFLTSKAKNANTSDASNQTKAGSNETANLLKKFSCKPKVKQTTTVKSQTGNNKILSLMLKRQNPHDDAGLRATQAKKAKIKIPQGEASNNQKNTGTFSILSTASSSQSLTAKQTNSDFTARPNKPAKLSSTNMTSAIPISINLAPQNLTSENIRAIKVPQTNGNSAGKPRKSSINAVLDKLVGEVNPSSNEPSNSDSSSSTSEQNSKVADSSKDSPSGTKTNKTKNQTNQFAIKQGGGLKLTVTKTKPSSSTASSSSSTSILTSSIPTPSIKYTIPKISKTQQQQVSQSGSSVSNQANSTDQNCSQQQQQQHHQNETSSNQNDSSANPSSSGYQSNASSSSISTSSSSSSSSGGNVINKRPPGNAFNRNSNSLNRDPVSSSTHPLGRTTSNPFAGAIRPSSSTNENHIMNRISSSSQSSQQATSSSVYTSFYRQRDGLVTNKSGGGSSSSSSSTSSTISKDVAPASSAVVMMAAPSMVAPAPGPAALVTPSVVAPSSLPVVPVQQQVVAAAAAAAASSIVGDPAEPTIITPSSPIECGHAEISAQPVLIPIDSLVDDQAAPGAGVVSPETDHPDDASDRLSIVDANEMNEADSNSIAETISKSL